MCATSLANQYTAFQACISISALRYAVADHGKAIAIPLTVYEPSHGHLLVCA